MSTLMLFMSSRTITFIFNFIIDYEISYCAPWFGPTSGHVLRVVAIVGMRICAGNKYFEKTYPSGILSTTIYA
jgi:hypothetical protein